MNIKDKIKAKMTGKVINKGINKTKQVIEAFDEDVKAIPDENMPCAHCKDCHERAIDTSDAFRKYFAIYLAQPKKGGFRK